MRLPLAVSVLLLGLLPGVGAAQFESPPSVTIAGATPKTVGEVLKRVLADQKFKVGVSDRRIMLTQDRGRVPQATGEVLRIRLEVAIRLDKVTDSLMLTMVDETLIGERGAGLEQRRTLDPAGNRTTYVNLLNRVKAELEGASPDADTTRSSASGPGVAP